MTARHPLVAGGVGTVGGAIAAALAADGYHVTVTARSREEIDRAAPELPAVALDVTDAAAVTTCMAGLSRLDALVNAAGITYRDDEEFQLPAFEHVVDVNLTGVMRLCTAARPLLARNGGSILNIASMLSYFGSPGVPAYAASKGGLVLLTRSLAAAWAREGIRVNAIAPGYIETALTRAVHDDPQRRLQIEQRTPLGRWGRPADLGGAAVFLCSPAAAFITGAVLPVDGGYSAV